MKDTFVPFTIVSICAVILLIIASMELHRPAPSQPFVCLTPYSLDYCRAHQGQIYIEQLQRSSDVLPVGTSLIQKTVDGSSLQGGANG